MMTFNVTKRRYPTLSKVREYVENYIVHEKKNGKVKWYNKNGLLYREFLPKDDPLKMYFLCLIN